MMAANVYDHMENVWQLDANPFPLEAISDSENGPYAELYPDETSELQGKFIRGGVDGGKLFYLWSRGAYDDTGFGKTRLMRHLRTKINHDLGNQVLAEAGMKPERRPLIAAAYATLNGTTTTSLYQIYFAAVTDLNAGHEHGEAPLAAALRLIKEKLAEEREVTPELVREQAVIDAVVTARRAMAPGGSPLRSDLVKAFAVGTHALKVALEEVSEATRMRSGMQFLDFALAALGAAGINDLFIFIDQLEDLATNPAITTTKRGREIGRIRDVLEEQPYARRLHQVLTFHGSAARKLGTYWTTHRLPRFDVAADNMSAIVELRGMTSDDQAREVLKVYLEQRRSEKIDDEMTPFEPGAITVLRKVSQGRVGMLLHRAHGLFHAAAERGLETIGADFANEFFKGNIGKQRDNHEEPAAVANGIDDLLLR